MSRNLKKKEIEITDEETLLKFQDRRVQGWLIADAYDFCYKANRLFVYDYSE